MMAKIVKGQSFGGCVRYVLNEAKAVLLESVGLPNGNASQIASDFELQAMLNPKVKNKVGHISLSFALQDTQMEWNDALMLKIAREYMERMDIRDTQHLIVRHTDREHSHCHIVFNRVDNSGRTISDKNDRFRSEKICKMLTAKYRLHFSAGKEQVNEDRLRAYDAKKYHIYNAIRRALPISQTWESFERRLEAQGVKMEFKYLRGSDERQGVKFEYGGVSFSGSKIDRAFSYANLDSRFANRQSTRELYQPTATQTVVPQTKESNLTEEVAGSIFSILSQPSPQDGNYDDQAAEFARQERLKKKKRRGRRM